MGLEWVHYGWSVVVDNCWSVFYCELGAEAMLCFALPSCWWGYSGLHPDPSCLNVVTCFLEWVVFRVFYFYKVFCLSPTTTKWCFQRFYLQWRKPWIIVQQQLKIHFFVSQAFWQIKLQYSFCVNEYRIRYWHLMYALIVSCTSLHLKIVPDKSVC